MKKWILVLCLVLTFSFLAIGYAQLSDSMSISGSISVTGQQYDIYITDITPTALDTVTVNQYYSTIMFASVHGASQPTFQITVKNQSSKTYVFERIVEGRETGFDDIYDGEGISYTLDNLHYLQEVAPGAEHTFRVTIQADSNVSTDHLLTFFKFIEKTGSEVLPGNPDQPEDTQPEETQPEDTQPEETQPEDTQPEETQPEETQPGGSDPYEPDPENNFYGLLNMLLSESNRCLNDPNDKKEVIFNAVQSVINDPPYLLHCLTPSIQGGNMANVTTAANQDLSENMHFVFTPDRQDPNTMYLYMYQAKDAVSQYEGQHALTYFCVIRRSSAASDWYADGVYVGKAIVAYLDGGGNSGNKEWTVDPASWTAGAP